MTARGNPEHVSAHGGAARSATAIALVALAMVGCAGPAAPDGPGLRFMPSREAYVLVAVDGAPLPAVTVQNEFTTVTTLADSIWLGLDGTGRRVTVERSHSPQALPEGEITRRSEHHFRYLVTGGVMEASVVCGPNALCVRPPHYRGTLTSTHLTLTYALYYRTPLEYRRADR